MFMGEYDHTIDAKGRMIMPAKFRDEIGEQFVLTLGLDGCLFAYSMKQWEEFLSDLNNLPGTKEARMFQRHFLANVAEAEMDKQGRVLIPPKLREKVGIDKEVTLVGMITRIEIWAKDRFAQDDMFDNVDDIADHMAEFGLHY